MKIPNFPLVLRKRRQSDRLPWRSVARFTITLLAASLLRREALALHHPPEMAHAAPSPVSNSSPVSKLFVPPPTRAPVGSTQGGASRSDHCQGVNGAPQLPIVLIPHGRQTIATPPTFFWFVPNNPPSSIFTSLSTIDETGEERTLYQNIMYDVESRVGLVDFTLPPNDGVEFSAQTYMWHVAVICRDRLRPDDPIISAVIDVEQPPSSLVMALEAARSPQERAELYAEAGYWYDALREAMAQRHSERSIAPSHQLDNSDPVISILRYLADTEGETDQGNLFRQIADQLEQEQHAMTQPSILESSGN
ncbi:MAG: DUF928 domain-containing protein [Cyanothece sp. SIO2G6]|nr:DUF928 domain-containing protein [Cyanothece sp. SIO2G6]